MKRGKNIAQANGYELTGLNCKTKERPASFPLDNNYIAGNDQIKAPTHYVHTSASSDKLYETIWGTDDNGISVSVYYEINRPS